ncbi:TetR/AcrR family transcriptional regulator [Mycobacterium aquaticum]|uniref:TetR/AcrR family transcriptional regulator n=1 Tax=Mycobacterium aquaticum TaxID=1927124 RepID=UPI001301CEC3|nr:TetR family transcriptional regulator [Mycobacterium aquaticum]
MEAEGLRQRRRRETATEIHRATLELARDEGFDKVTVDAISARAGISQRTFFNYFSSKEAALVHGPFELAADRVLTFVAAGPCSPRQMLTDVIDLLMENMAELPPQREVMKEALTVASGHPSVLAAFLARVDHLAQQIADTIAERAGDRIDDVDDPTVIAALAVTAVRLGMDRWMATSPGPEGADSPAPHVHHIAVRMHAVMEGQS